MPVVERDGERIRVDQDRPHSVGRVRSFFGNFGMMVRAYAYIRELGPEGLRAVSDLAVLNANYLAARLRPLLPLAFETAPLHEAVFTDRELEAKTGVKTLDVAKRLIDYGFHPPTVYFPLVVRGALMIEPTETDRKPSKRSTRSSTRSAPSSMKRKRSRTSCAAPRTSRASAASTKRAPRASRACAGPPILPVADLPD